MLQVVSGAPLTAFWGATYAWDAINFTIPIAGARFSLFVFCVHVPGTMNQTQVSMSAFAAHGHSHEGTGLCIQPC